MFNDIEYDGNHKTGISYMYACRGKMEAQLKLIVQLCGIGMKKWANASAIRREKMPMIC